MVSEKIVAVLLIVTIVVSVLSIVLTLTLSVATPVRVVGQPKTEDSSGAKVSLVISPVKVPVQPSG